MMYVDFEAILNSIQVPSPDLIKPYTKEVKRDEPYGYCNDNETIRVKGIDCRIL